MRGETDMWREHMGLVGHRWCEACIERGWWMEGGQTCERAIPEEQLHKHKHGG